MILIMVIVVLVLLALMGTAAIQVVRVDRVANHQFNYDSIDTVAAATISDIQRALLNDLFDERGVMFNAAVPVGISNKGGGRAPYDYPWTNNTVTGQFLYPTATGGLFDDTWLSSTAPDFVTSPTNPQWNHLTNLYGVFIDLPSNATSQIVENPVDNTNQTLGDTNVAISFLDAPLSAQYDKRGVDTDGDGIPDARWTYAPIRTIGGISYYAAVRVVDNSALANLGVWTSQVSSTGLYDTTDAGLHAPRWAYPTELDLGSFVLNTDTTKASRMTELQRYLRFRMTGNEASAAVVLPTPWFNAAAAGGADMFRIREPWSRPKPPPTPSYEYNVNTRGHHWLRNASTYFLDTALTGTGAYTYKSPRLEEVEMLLRRNGGLANPTLAMPVVGASVTGLYTFLRQDVLLPAESSFTDFTATQPGGDATYSAANMKIYFEQNPRVQATVHSGRAIYTMRLPDLTAATPGSHNSKTFTVGTPVNPATQMNINDPAIPLQAAAIPDAYMTTANNTTFWNSPLQANAQAYLRPAQGQMVQAMSNEIRRVIERGTFRLPWKPATATTSADRERFANALAYNIASFTHGTDADMTQNYASVGGPNANPVGWRPLPVITEVYLQRTYIAAAATAHPDADGTWQVQWAMDGTIGPLPSATGGTGFAIEIRNPYPYAIDIRSVRIGGVEIMLYVTGGTNASTWTAAGRSMGNNYLMRPTDVILLYYNPGTTFTGNDDLTSRFGTPEPGMVHHPRNLRELGTSFQSNFSSLVQEPALDTLGFPPPPTSVSLNIFYYNIISAAWVFGPNSNYQTISVAQFDDRGTPRDSAYLNGLKTIPSVNPLTVHLDPLYMPVRSNRLLEDKFYDPSYLAPATSPVGVKRYKQRTYLGNGNGLNAFTIANAAGPLRFVTRTNFVPVAQAASPSAYVAATPFIAKGSQNGIPNFVAKGTYIPEILRGSINGIYTEELKGSRNPPSPKTWADFPGDVVPVGGINDVYAPVAKGANNPPSGGWAQFSNPPFSGYVPAGFYGPGNPPANIYPDPPTDLVPIPSAPMTPDPPTDLIPDPPTTQVADPPNDLVPIPPADIPAVPATPEGAFTYAPEPPYPFSVAVSYLGRKDKTTATTVQDVAIAPYSTNLATLPWLPGPGGDANSLLARQELIYPTAFNLDFVSLGANYALPQYARLRNVGMISMVAAIPWLAGGQTFPEFMAAASPAITDIEKLMLDYRSPNFVGTEGNYAVPHAVMIMDRFTTLSPRYDHIDNDGDSVIDNPEELLIRGMLNINTATREMLRKVLPIPDAAVRDYYIDRLIEYRDMTNSFAAADRGVAAGFRTTSGQGLKGIAYTGEFFTALSALPTDSRNIGNNFAGAVPINDSALNGTVIDWWGPNANKRKTEQDTTANDRKEKMMIPAMLSGVLTTRSDIYTAYVVVKGYPTGDFSQGAIESARLMVLFDRSSCTDTSKTVRIKGIVKY